MWYIINGDKMKIKPDMYVKDILSINYKKLKQKGIKVLFFDFDNTIIEMGNYTLNKEYEILFEDLKNDFKILIVSNSIHKSKLDKVCSKYNLSYVGSSFKPFSFGFKKAEKIVNCKKNEICMIGDQLLTDVKGGINMNYFTILIDPISDNEHLLTKINRYRENKIFKRGKYYE